MHANPQKADSTLSGMPRTGQCWAGKTWSSLGWSKVFHQESPGSTKFIDNCSSTSPFDSIEMTNAPDGMHRILKEMSGPAIDSISFRTTSRGSPYFRKKEKSFSDTRPLSPPEDLLYLTGRGLPIKGALHWRSPSALHGSNRQVALRLQFKFKTGSILP